MNKYIRSINLLVLGLVLVLAPAAFTGCGTPNLQTGGAYAPTNSVGQPLNAPDLGFYAVEASFKFAHQTFLTACQLEEDNRQLLWKISPEIKKGLDQARVQFNQFVLEYAKARDVYHANPTPAGLDEMSFWLAKIKQLATTAEAVTANVQKGK